MPQAKETKKPHQGIIDKYVDYSGYECNLECSKIGSFKDFIGPVKIILLETPPEVYKKNVFHSSMVAFTYLFIGVMFMASAMFAFNYALPYKYNGHILYCTAAYQVLFPIGILSYNRSNTIAKYETPKERKIEHIICQVSGFLCAMYGAYSVSGIPGGTWHSITGFWAGFLLFFATGVSVATLKVPPPGQEHEFLLLTTIHKGLGIGSSYFGCICYMTGVNRSNFKNWYQQEPYAYFLMLICFFNTIVVLKDATRIFIIKMVRLKRSEDISELDDDENFRRFGETKKKLQQKRLIQEVAIPCEVHKEWPGLTKQKVRIPCSECCMEEPPKF